MTGSGMVGLSKEMVGMLAPPMGTMSSGLSWRRKDVVFAQAPLRVATMPGRSFLGPDRSGYVLRGRRGGKWRLTEVCYGAILSDRGV